ncbi:MAG: NfeD family protein [Planctomycetaceae bacterium]
MPDAGVLATILLIVGLFLLILEFFIPSFGLIGIVALISLLVSLWSAWQAWGGGRNPSFFYTYLGLLVCGIPGTLGLGFYLLQYSAIGKSVILQPPTLVQVPNPLEELIGKVGTTQTLLTPGGMVVVEKNRYHAESTGMLIDPNTPVIVVEVRSSRLVVRPVGASEMATAVTIAEPRVTTEDSGHSKVDPLTADIENTRELNPDQSRVRSDKLDFDIPEDYTA